MFQITGNKIKVQVARKFKGQKKLVFEALATRLENKPATARQIIEIVKDDIKSKMDPARVIRYYLCEMKQEGVIKSTGRECDSRCLMAVSDECDCECEGKNHGALRKQVQG